MARTANKAADEKVKKYRVTNRLLSWRGEDGAEVDAHEGAIVTDVPEAALVWYLSEGHMVEVGSQAEAAYKKRDGGHTDDSANAH